MQQDSQPNPKTQILKSTLEKNIYYIIPIEATIFNLLQI